MKIGGRLAIYLVDNQIEMDFYPRDYTINKKNSNPREVQAKWHNFCFSNDVMDIERINRKHFLGLDMYYRVGFGLSSKLIKFENSIIHLEVMIGRKWKKNYNATAAEMAYAWKNSHMELGKALACKVFIVDSKKNPYKQFLVQSGIRPDYDAKKGIIFAKQYLN